MRRPLPQNEVCNRLTPYVKPFNLRLTESEICFPEMPLDQIVFFTRYVHGKYFFDGIPYKSIVYMDEDQDGLYICLKDGGVFFLGKNSKLGVYSYSDVMCKRRKRVLSELNLYKKE